MKIAGRAAILKIFAMAFPRRARWLGVNDQAFGRQCQCTAVGSATSASIGIRRNPEAKVHIPTFIKVPLLALGLAFAAAGAGLFFASESEFGNVASADQLAERSVGSCEVKGREGQQLCLAVQLWRMNHR
jgi:hypothetical protein